MSDKKEIYTQAIEHLNRAQLRLQDLQSEFEDDENAHDMSTVQDLRQELDDLEARLLELPDSLLSGELS